jgi:hypothetical protein
MKSRLSDQLIPTPLHSVGERIRSNKRWLNSSGFNLTAPSSPAAQLSSRIAKEVACSAFFSMPLSSDPAIRPPGHYQQRDASVTTRHVLPYYYAYQVTKPRQPALFRIRVGGGSEGNLTLYIRDHWMVLLFPPYLSILPRSRPIC